MQRGFTLLELLVVLAIVALVASVALPALSNRSGTELKAAARTIAAELRETRHKAITSRKPTALQVDVEQRSIELEGHTESFSDNLSLRLFTARSETTGPGQGAIRFFPDGTSTGGEITVFLPGRGFAIQVDWFTGRVKTLAYEGELPERLGNDPFSRLTEASESI